MKYIKFISPVAILLFLLYIFLYTDEKKDDTTEVNFWRYDFDELRYIPGKNDSDEKFFNEKFEIKRIHKGLKSNPFFRIHKKDSGKDISYEAGHLSKNLFTDFSVLNTKTMAEADEEILKKFSINDHSPRIELYNSGELGKILRIGSLNRDRSYRYLEAEGYLIGIPDYIISRFTGEESLLRQKQLLTIGDDLLLSLNYSGDMGNFQFVNVPNHERNPAKQVWLKAHKSRIRINPSSISNLDGIVKKLSYDIYPDDEKGEGQAVAENLVSDKEIHTLEIHLVSGKKIRIRFFPPVMLNSVFYHPVLRTIDDWKESPAYINQSNVNTLLQAIKHIEDEPPWSDQKQNQN
ncbi:MAG: hypothetical protein H7A24_02275 [Leptospiraceae bacterium]|nr:hypothetical protein [Leptospiraceae bacterium]MCP5510676.1 hypothetical protein [Leptospiraceae bacterium]